MKDTFRNFSSWTSAHGIPQIGRATNWCVRIFWLVILLGAVIMFAIQLYGMITKYKEYPIKVQTEMRFERLVFPVITVCNINAYKNRKLERYAPDLDQLMKDHVFLLANGVPPAPDPYDFSKINSQLEMQMLAKNIQVYMAANFTENQLDQITYSYEELIKECYFGGHKCSKSDFVKIYDPTYGACYKFNTEKKYLSERAGNENGLKLVITVNQEEKNGETDFLATTETNAARVSITPQGTDVSVDSLGLNAGAGFVNVFAIHFSETERLKEPYGSCVDEMSTENCFNNGSYTKESCYSCCTQRHFIEHCQCQDTRYILTSSHTRFCSPSDAHCIRDLQKSFEIVNGTQVDNENRLAVGKDCACPPPCKENSYSTTVSQSQFPADNFAIPDCVQYEKNEWTSKEHCIRWYRENSLVLQVFFERMNYELIKEVEAYTIGDASFDLGGQLGLWLGVSVISVIEVFFIFVPNRTMAPVSPINEDKKELEEDFDRSDSEADEDSDSGGDHSEEDKKNSAALP